MELKTKESRLNSVPELPIIPAFLTLVEFGLTIKTSPDFTWKKSEYSLIKGILLVPKLKKFTYLKYIHFVIM